MGWVGCPKLLFTGGVKSRVVVQCIDILGAHTEVRFAVAVIEIERVRTWDLLVTSRSSGKTR